MSKKIMRWLENRNKIKIWKFENKKPHEKYMEAEVKSKTNKIYSMIRTTEVN